jgi:hypothetical protein
VGGASGYLICSPWNSTAEILAQTGFATGPNAEKIGGLPAKKLGSFPWWKINNAADNFFTKILVF